MPWKSQSIMEQRREFIGLALLGDVSVAELCRRYGISRQSGFGWLRRYREAGDAELEGRSRRPHSVPKRCDAAVEARIVALRAAHPCWGGRKLARRLRVLGVPAVPAPSTVTQVLRRHGLLDPHEAAKTGQPRRTRPGGHLMASTSATLFTVFKLTWISLKSWSGMTLK